MKKKLVFITEARFFCDFNDVIYFDKDFDVKLWDRYLEYFDELIVVARVQEVEGKYVNNIFPNKNSRIKFIKLPYFVGLKELLKNIFQLRNILKHELFLLKNNSFILRVPGVIGFNAARILNKFKIYYSAEVVGDPADVFAQGNFNHSLRPLLRFIAIYQLKYVVRNAVSVLYVTQTALQNKYPISANSSSFGISDVRIEDNIIRLEPRKHHKKPIYQIISVGSLAQLYKSPDILLKAIHFINSKENDFKVKLIWLGEGIYKDQMINLAQELGIEKDVNFFGSVSREEVVSKITNSDLFVLASKTEGLPRVIVEAMAMGLPVVATNVGGIPELLPKEVLVKASNFEELAYKIHELLTHPKLYNEQANKNLLKAHEFKKSILDEKRKQFFNSTINFELQE